MPDVQFPRDFMNDTHSTSSPDVTLPATTEEFQRRRSLLVPLLVTSVICITSALLGASFYWQLRVAEVRALAEAQARLSELNRVEAIREEQQAAAQHAETQVLVAELKRQNDEASKKAIADAEARLSQVQHHSDLVAYTRAVHSANNARLSNNFTQATDDLQNCPQGLRGWEWNYLHKQINLGTKVLNEHQLPVVRVSFTPDSQKLASVSGEWYRTTQGELSLWEVATGRILETRRPHKGAIFDVAIHPSNTLLATAGFNWNGTDEPQLSDFETGRVVSVLEGTGNSFATRFSPDGRWLAIAGSNGHVRLCEAANGNVVRILTGHKDNVFGLAFSADSHRLVTAGRDGLIQFWDMKEFKLVHSLSGLSDVRAISLSPDGEFLAAINYSGMLYLWDADGRTEKAVRHTNLFPGHDVCFSPDSQWLGVAAGERTLIIDPLTNEVRREFPKHQAGARSVAFSPNSRWLATSGRDASMRLCDLTVEVEQRPTVLFPLAINVSDFAIHPNGKTVAVAVKSTSDAVHPNERSVRILGIDDHKEIRRLTGHTQWLTQVAYSPDGSQLASVDRQGVLRLWDSESGKAQHIVSAHSGAANAVAYHPNGTSVATGGSDQLIKIWDPKNGQLLNTLRGHQYSVLRLAFSPDGNRIYSGSEGGELRGWSLDPAEEFWSQSAHQGPINALAVSPDGRWLATGGQDRKALLWDLTAPKERRDGDRSPRQLLLHPDFVTGLAFSPNSQRLIVAGEVHGLTLFELTTGLVAMNWSQSITGAPIRFSPDGHKIVLAWHNQFLTLDDRVPGVVSSDELAARHIAWHRREALAAEQRGLPFAVLHHLQQLPDSEFADTRWLHRRVIAEMGAQRWAEAAKDFERLADRPGEDPVLHLFSAACFHWMSRDEPAYRDLCKRYRERFRLSPSLVAAGFIAGAYAFADHDVAELNELATPLELGVLLPLLPDNKAALLRTLGGVLYRAGRYEDALKRLDECVQMKLPSPYHTEWAFLAMTHHRLGHAKEAQAWLDKLQAEVDRSNPPFKFNQRRRSYGNRMTLLIDELLLKEAKAFLTSATSE